MTEIDDTSGMYDSSGNKIHFNEKQEECINYSGRSALVIKGTAGSGKSLMLAKIAFDIRKEIIESDSHENVLFVSYTNSLVQGTKELLAKNGITKDDEIVDVGTLDKILAKLVRKKDLIPKTSRRAPGQWNQRRRYSNNDGPCVDDDLRIKLVEEALDRCKSKESHPYYNLDPEFWADEILWMYRNGIVDSDDYQTYLSIKREGRCKDYNTRMTRKSRTIAFNIFDMYNTVLFEKGKFEWDRLYALLYRDICDDKNWAGIYDYIIIDEAQDLSLVKMKLAVRLCRNAEDHIFIAIDRNQSLYGQRWSFKKDIGIDAHVKTLVVIHRCTRQIDQLAQDLKRIDDTLLQEGDRYENEKSDKEGAIPIVCKCPTIGAEMDVIVSLCNAFLKREMKWGMTLAVLCPDWTHIKRIKRLLNESGIETDVQGSEDFSPFSPGIKVLTVHSAKGLGFIKVVIPFFEDGIYPKSSESIQLTLRKKNRDSTENSIDIGAAMAEEISDSRRLAYVAITRAAADLCIIYSGNPSRFLSEFDKDHYHLVDELFEDTTDERIDMKHEVLIRHPIIEPNKDPVYSGSTGTIDPVLDFLGDHDVEYIDRRHDSGTLWIIDGPNANDAVEYLKGRGLDFGYLSKGARVTGRRPAWYLM